MKDFIITLIIMPVRQNIGEIKSPLRGAYFLIRFLGKAPFNSLINNLFYYRNLGVKISRIQDKYS